jgi:hypothetical protein
MKRETIPWLYLRLFYTESQLGWDSDLDPWYTQPIFQHILFTIFICVATAVALKVWQRRAFCGREDHISWPTAAVLLCIIIPAFVTLHFMIGPDYQTSSNGVIRMDSKGCCTQGLIYPRHQVPALVSMLREETPGPEDLKIENWANKQGIARFAMTPPVVQHVGVFSTRGTKKKIARQTWAYRFEDQDKKKLARQHEQLSRWGIWRAETFDE